VVSDLNIETTTILNEVENIIDENSKMESTTISNENQVEDIGKFFFNFFFELNHLIFYYNKEAKNNVSNSSVFSAEVDQNNIESTTILNEVDKIKVENLEIDSTGEFNDDVIDSQSFVTNQQTSGIFN
jgi:hypothetical protein